MNGATAAADVVLIWGTLILLGTNALSFVYGKFGRGVRRRGGWRYVFLICFGRSRKVIRFSSTALLSLEHADHYLMVRSRSGDEVYWAPVGGVLKRHGSARAELSSLGARPDVGTGLDMDRADDLRLFVPARKFSKFLDWYQSERGRETIETALIREMYEELGDAGLNVKDWFQDLRLPLSRVYQAPPAIFRDPHQPHLWHYRVFATLELEEPARQCLLDAVLAGAPECMAFISHRGIESREFQGTPVGFHTDALLHRRIDPGGLYVDPNTHVPDTETVAAADRAD